MAPAGIPGSMPAFSKNIKKTEGSWKEQAKKWFAAETPISLDRGHEYAAFIINAIKGGEMFTFNGNVPNTGLITNLPESACVEVPVYVDRGGLHPVHVGALPLQCVALNHVSVMVEEMAVEAALTGNPHLAFQSIAYDPLTAAVLSLAEIKTMVNELFEINKNHLPQFKHFEA